MEKSNGRIFVKNAAILTATSLLLKAVGMYFRIYVTSLIGAQGIGLYQLIMSVYVLFSGFAASGIVVAVTRMTADEMVRGSVATVRLVLRRCLAVSFIMGAVSSAVLVLLAGPIGRQWISDPRAVASLRVCAGALPFMSVSCCLRGYFTARRKAAPSSMAQMTEQTVRIAASVILLGLMAGRGAEYACIALMVADVISEGAGCAYVTIAYLIDRRKLVCADESVTDPGYAVGRRIREIALPITASHYLTTLLRTVENILVPDCLTIFEQSRSRALELFGLVKGMALPLILFPSSLLTAFSSLLVPEISQALTLGRKSMISDAVRRSMLITFTLSVPVGGVFLLYPQELGLMLYKNAELSGVLRILAPLTPLMYSESVAVGILRGLGEQKSSLRYGIIDSVVRIVLISAAVPRFGLTGFMAVMVVSNLLTPTLHLNRLMRTAETRFDIGRWLVRPLISCAAGYAAAMLISPAAAGFPMIWRVCAGSGAMLGVYLCMMYLIGGISKEDIRI